MPSPPLANKNIHLSSGGQACGSDHGDPEITEVQYSHFHTEGRQCGPQDYMEARSHPATVMAAENISPPPQPIDLSFLNDDECLVMPCEKTPASFGEVPDFVLTRIRSEENQASSPAKGSASSQKCSMPAARVCLEKRFNTLSPVTPKYRDVLYSAFI